MWKVFAQTTNSPADYVIMIEKLEWKKIPTRRIDLIIPETCLYNFDPLKSHFYIVKLGFTGVYIIFHISAQKIDCVYSVEPPHRGGSNEYLQINRYKFWAETWKKLELFALNFLVFWRWIFLYIMPATKLLTTYLFVYGIIYFLIT